MNKILIACLVALAASQMVVAKPKVRSINDQVAAALGELDEMIQSTLTDAEGMIKDNLEKGKSAARDIIDEVNTDVTEGLKPLKEKVAERKRALEAEGRDTTGCDELIAELDTIAPKLTAEVQVKVDEILTDAEVLEVQLLEQGKEIAQIVPDLQKALEECKTEVCAAGILRQVTGYLVSLPKKISKMVADSMDFEVKTLKKASKLAADETQKGLNEGKRLTEQILTCLDASPVKEFLQKRLH